MLKAYFAVFALLTGTIAQAPQAKGQSVANVAAGQVILADGGSSSDKGG